MLQIGKADAAHERVSVQSRPRASFEVIGAEFLFGLLVRPLAHPARLDRGGKGPLADSGAGFGS